MSGLKINTKGNLYILHIKDEIVIGDSTFPQLKTQVKKKLLFFKNTIC